MAVTQLLVLDQQFDNQSLQTRVLYLQLVHSACHLFSGLDEYTFGFSLPHPLRAGDRAREQELHPFPSSTGTTRTLVNCCQHMDEAPSVRSRSVGCVYGFVGETKNVPSMTCVTGCLRTSRNRRRKLPGHMTDVILSIRITSCLNQLW